MTLRIPALLRCELKRLPHRFSTYAMSGFATLVALLTVLSPPEEERALLFMVAGDDPKRIGGAVGFIGNLVALDDLVGSAIRTSLVFTILWIPVVIIYAVFVTAQDYSTLAGYDVSKARGTPETAMVASKLIVHGGFLTLLYLLTCFMPFVCKVMQYGPALSSGSVGRFLGVASLGAIMLAALFAEAFALYQLVRSTVVATVAMVMPSLFALVWFPSSYAHAGGMGGLNPTLYLSPVLYLMNTCALCFQNVDAWAVVLYASVAEVASFVVSCAVLRLGEMR